MDEKFWRRFEGTLDKKLDEKLEEKLDKKLDEKLDKKFEENNSKLIKIMDEKFEENNNKLMKSVDEKFEIQNKKMVSDVTKELGRIVDIIGERIEKVEEKQDNILQELRVTRKELTARANCHEYRLELLEEKVG